MKVCIIHNIIWSHYKAIVFSELYKQTQQEEVELLVLQIATNQKQRADLGKVDLTIHQYPYKLLFNQPFEKIPQWRIAFSLLRELLLYKPDIIVTPGIEQPAYWPLMVIARLLNIRLATTYDSTELDHPRIWYKESFKRLLFKLENLVFCYGTASKKYLRKLHVPESKIHIRVQATHNAKIEAGYLQSKDDNSFREQYDFPDRYFLYVGRLSAEKNLKRLILAFGACQSDWGLVLIGSGDQAQPLQKLVKEQRIANVFMPGSCPWYEVSRFYAHTTAFVLPSTSEPWGLVVNEAMLCRLPVIVSSHCGCAPDLVEETQNGFTFDPYSTAALSAILKRFIEGNVDAQAMGSQSYAIIKHYSPQRAAAQMLNGFRKIIPSKTSLPTTTE